MNKEFRILSLNWTFLLLVTSIVILISGCSGATQTQERIPSPTPTKPTITDSPPTSTSGPTITPSPIMIKAPMEEEVVSWLEENGIPFETPMTGSSCEDLEPLMAMIGDARIVALGEATHGTSEFFSMKHHIIECLVKKKGFTQFAIEANLPESELVNDYVTDGNGDPTLLLSGLYFWIWNTQEVLDMIKWMRSYNQKTMNSNQVEFHGFDMQNGSLAADNVVGYLRKYKPESEEKVERWYSCLRPYLNKIPQSDNPQDLYDYMNLTKSKQDACRDNLQAVYNYLKENETELISQSSMQEFKYILHNAKLVLQTEGLYSSRKSRDKYMAENVSWLMEEYRPNEKVVLWAHNGHIQNFFSRMGGHLSERYGEDILLVGFSFYSGKFNAKDFTKSGKPAYSDPVQFEFKPPSLGSVEYYFHKTGMERFYVDLRTIRDDPDHPAASRLNGYIPFYGIIGGEYNPQKGNQEFLREPIASLFDIMIYFNKTTPSSLLPVKPVYAGELVGE